MFKQLMNPIAACQRKVNKTSLHNFYNHYYGIKSFSVHCVMKSSSSEQADNNNNLNNNNLIIEENNNSENTDVNNNIENNSTTRGSGEKQNRNLNKLFKKRDQTLETAKKFKDLNRKFSPTIEEPKKKKASPDLKKAIKLLKFMDVMEKASQGIDFDQEEEFAKYDHDDDVKVPEKKSTVAKTRRTMDYHLDERNFNLQKPVPKTILKGQMKEIKRARKIIDDDEKHLKDKKPFKF